MGRSPLFHRRLMGRVARVQGLPRLGSRAKHIPPSGFPIPGLDQLDAIPLDLAEGARVVRPVLAQALIIRPRLGHPRPHIPGIVGVLFLQARGIHHRLPHQPHPLRKQGLRHVGIHPLRPEQIPRIGQVRLHALAVVQHIAPVLRPVEDGLVALVAPHPDLQPAHPGLDGAGKGATTGHGFPVHVAQILE